LSTFADDELQWFSIMARMAKSGLATIHEIETRWTWEDIQMAIDYMNMVSDIENEIRKVVNPKTE
jgi:hypothetical protein